MGIPNVKTYSDSVFALTGATPAEIADVRKAFGVEGAKYMVLTARKLGGLAGDEQKLALQATAARDLLSDGTVDTCLVIRQTGGSNGDLAMIQRLAAAIGRGARVCDWDYSHRDLMSLYAGACLVLTQHLHSFIFSVLSGTPCLVMSTTTNKVQGLVQGLALPDWLVLGKEMSGTEVTQSLRRAVAETPGLGVRMANARREAQESLVRFEVDLQALARRGIVH
jgi:polysaccharide pyruvyl transferase WcaK-like protein